MALVHFNMVCVYTIHEAAMRCTRALHIHALSRSLPRTLYLSLSLSLSLSLAPTLRLLLRSLKPVSKCRLGATVNSF